MEFFDKIGKKASEAYKITADKTGKLAKEAKIRLKISELKSQINEIYEEIGKNVYQNHINKETINLKEKLEEDCARIDIISAEIEAKLKECLELRDRKQCPNCYTEMDKDVKFCPECGAKQEIEEAKEVEIIDNVEVQDTVKEDNDKTENSNQENSNQENSNQENNNQENSNEENSNQENNNQENSNEENSNEENSNQENNNEENSNQENNNQENNNPETDKNEEEHKDNLQKTVEIETNIQEEEIQNISEEELKNKMKEDE